MRDEDLARLQAFPNLERVWIQLSPVTDKGLEHLKPLRSLKEILLRSVDVSDTGYACLREFPALEWLYLTDGRFREGHVHGIGDQGLAHIAKLSTLKGLDLEGSRVTDEGLVHLRNLSSLERLSLAKTRVEGSGLQHLMGSRTLRSLDLRGLTLSAAGMENLKKFDSLESLDLQGAKIGVAEVQELRRALPRARLLISQKVNWINAPLNVGDLAPDFSVSLLDGRPFQLSEHRGKPVLLHFWATWCAPCVASTPELKNLEAELRGASTNVVMLSLSLDQLDATVRRHVTKFDLKWPHAVIGLNSGLRSDYLVEGVPRYIMVGADGRILSLGSQQDDIRAQHRKL